MKKEIKNRLIKLCRSIYAKLFLINDTPQKIALGFGLGVFLGVMPGMGPIASLFLASLFRLNRSAALLGSIMLNTWINFVTLLLAIKIGSVIMGLNWSLVYAGSISIFKDFRFAKLFELPVLKIIAPILIGYFVIAACAAMLAYLAVLIILNVIRRRRQVSGKDNG
jgi:uncharacterized protein (DUF2062 family)